MTSSSILTPSFLSKLESPKIRTVLICGCGSGFELRPVEELPRHIDMRSDRRFI